MRRLRPLVVPAQSRHSASLIFCHGFGATSADWLLLSEFDVLQSHVKLVLPQAPMRPISISGGTSQPAWFDIRKLAHEGRHADGDEDEAGMRDSLDTLDALVAAELRAGIPRNRIVVGGFSQGAALALLYGLTRPKDEALAGTVVLSGYGPLQWKLASMKSECANQLAVFWAHGTADAVIPIATSERAVTLLKESGMSNIEYHSYKGMQHGFDPEELQDLHSWLAEQLPEPPSPVEKL